MSRAPLVYADVPAATRPSSGLSVETPTAGFYRFKLIAGGFPVAVRIWHGPPVDPVTGDVLDRSWRWQATCNDEPIDLERVWPACGRDPIDQAEHDHLCDVAAWAKVNAPNSPQANPRRKINRLSAPLLI